MILRLIRWGASLLALTFLAVTIWTFLWPVRDMAAVPQVDAILCLGGGIGPGGLAPETRRRAETCAALYLAGKAQVMVMSAGTFGGGSRSGGALMADVVVAAGVPSDAIRIEGRSYSTLQNMAYSRPLLPDTARVIVVTEAFHLPRAWASARWAGFDEVRLVPSEHIRGEEGRVAQARMLLRETLAIWFNAGRIAAYEAGALAGISEDRRLKWLH